VVPLLDEVFDPLDSGQVQHEYVAVLQPAADLHAAAATAVYADAKGWAPDAELVAVKQCIDRYTAACLPPARTAGLITKAAAAGLTAPFNYKGDNLAG